MGNGAQGGLLGSGFWDNADKQALDPPNPLIRESQKPSRTFCRKLHARNGWPAPALAGALRAAGSTHVSMNEFWREGIGKQVPIIIVPPTLPNTRLPPNAFISAWCGGIMSEEDHARGPRDICGVYMDYRCPYFLPPLNS